MSGRLKEVIVGILFAGALVHGTERQAISHDPKSSALDKAAPRRQVRLPIKDFSLTDQEGRSFKFQELKGKAVLVGFIYTTCPDVCPLITASMRLVQEELDKKERGLVFLLSITTDPEVDAPQVLKAYAERYRIDFSNWSFITGDLQSLSPVWKSFGVKVDRKARGLINHTSLTALIDKQGVMRFAYYGVSPDPKTILRDIRGLLDKGGGP
jgi:protein SCO1/2